MSEQAKACFSLRNYGIFCRNLHFKERQVKGKMRSEWVKSADFDHLLAALMPQNRLALETSMETGLRIGDVLNFRTDRLKPRMGVREQKTGKYRTVYLPARLYDRLVANAGKIYVFEGRNDYRKHRTRGAVYNDLVRAAKLFRIDGKRVHAHVTPHSARKLYAVSDYRRHGDMKRIQKLLNHTSEAVTMLYAFADILTERRERHG